MKLPTWLRFLAAPDPVPAVPRTDVTCTQPSPVHDSLRSPYELEIEAKRWQNQQDELTQSAFDRELPQFHAFIISKLEAQFRRPSEWVLVSCPRAIYERPDLIDLRIVPWLRQRGWQCTHERARITPSEYDLFIRPFKSDPRDC